MSDNTVYVITGGNRGLGLGLVSAFLSRPSTTVIATVRNTEALHALQTESKVLSLGSGSKLHIAILDFSTAIPPEQVLATIQASVAANDAPPLTHINILINNAALCTPFTPALNTTASSLRASFETNTIAPLLITQALWPLLQASLTSHTRAPPKVIMMSSSVGCITTMEPFPGGAYGPSKAALNWLTKSLHAQGEESGLIALAMHPGWVKTRAGEFVASEWKYEAGPPHSLEQSVGGMIKVIDGATRESWGGKFVMFDGQELAW